MYSRATRPLGFHRYAPIYVSLPQMIVCGDQSSGKISVLEAELVLRKNTKAGVRISIVLTNREAMQSSNPLVAFANTSMDLMALPV